MIRNKKKHDRIEKRDFRLAGNAYEEICRQMKGERKNGKRM